MARGGHTILNDLNSPNLKGLGSGSHLPFHVSSSAERFVQNKEIQND